jgi:RimJ/RimL family protein N-acetyltransferase
MSSTLCRVPESFTTQRLTAERLVASHLDAVHTMHRDAEQMRLLGGVREFAASEEYVAKAVAHWERHGFGAYILRDRATGEISGRALLRLTDIEGVGEVEVGYGFYPRWWGRGLGTEIARTLVAYARELLGLRTLVAVTTRENVGSQRVLENVGLAFDRDFVQDGHRKMLYRISWSPS